MAPRAIWKGAVSVGLVSVPVKLYTAVRPKDVRFNELHAADLARLKHVRICAAENREVPYDEIVKGYEIAPDTYVTITAEDLAAVTPRATRTVQIEQFTDAGEIDPLLFERTYHVGPDRGGERTFALLAEALAETGKMGVGSVVLRSKQYLATLRASGEGLLLSTMHYPDEVVPPETLEDLPGDDVEIRDRELAIARQLIESLATDFDHAKYRDTYRERVLELIEQKAAGKEPALQPIETPAAPDDLLAALEASLAATKGRGDGAAAKAEPAPRRRRRPAEGG